MSEYGRSKLLIISLGVADFIELGLWTEEKESRVLNTLVSKSQGE